MGLPVDTHTGPPAACDRADLPMSWRKSKLSVLFKASDRQLPKNYRPIAIIPVLTKHYSKILLRRVQELVERTQVDRVDTQFGNRKGRGCSDAVHILRMIVEKSIEWGEGIAAADVEKASRHRRQLAEVIR